MQCNNRAIDSGKTIKHFEAVCPIARFFLEKSYRQATSNTATDFFYFLQKKLPSPLFSIQVDGGSEFKGAFERACKDFNIPLYVFLTMLKIDNQKDCPEQIVHAIRRQKIISTGADYIGQIETFFA